MKYILTEHKLKWCSFVMTRIRAIRSFKDVKEGDLGGYVENENNLGQEGDCWISGEARCVGRAFVSDNALVSGNARIYDNALVYGNAWVYGNARVYNNARVYGTALVSGAARVFGAARIFGNALIDNNYVCICGRTKININMVTGITENITGVTLVDREFLVPEISVRPKIVRPKIVSAIRWLEVNDEI